jgi:general stress protein CsbA
MTAASEGSAKLERRAWRAIAIQAVLIAAVYSVGRELVNQEGVIVTFVVSAISALLVFTGLDLAKKRLAAGSKGR